jgi:MFS family permease
LPPPPKVVSAKPVTVSLGWHGVDAHLRALIIAAGGLALATTPEVFLVLWAQAGGLEIVWVPLLWAAASAVKVVVAIPGGHWSDQFGRLPVLVVGWGARILILIALGLTATGELTIWTLFLAYAGSLAFTEGAERALIGDYAPAGQKATAYGVYHMISGVLALPGALLFGALWQWFGATTAFLTAAGLTTISVLILLMITSTKRT